MRTPTLGLKLAWPPPAFTAQVAVLTILAMHLGRRLGQLEDQSFMRLMTG